jgi:hypothetical protein
MSFIIQRLLNNRNGARFKNKFPMCFIIALFRVWPVTAAASGKWLEMHILGPMQNQNLWNEVSGL